MEAPENIYLFENPIDNTPDYRWLSKRSCNDDVEYIRKDAFIEKATNFLNNKLGDVVAMRVPGTIIPYHVAKQEVIEELKRELKK